jgi:hypothetical protein
LEVMLEKKEDVNITKDVGEDRFFWNVCNFLPNYTPQKHNPT